MRLITLTMSTHLDSKQFAIMLKQEYRQVLITLEQCVYYNLATIFRTSLEHTRNTSVGGTRYVCYFRTENVGELYELRSELFDDPKSNDSESDNQLSAIERGAELVYEFREEIDSESEFLENIRGILQLIQVLVV